MSIQGLTMANKSHLSAHLKLPDYQSALSPYVRKLILENTYSAHQDTKVLNKDGLIDFSYICSKLDDEPADVLATSYFCESVQVLGPMLHYIEKMLLSQNVMELKKFLRYFQWTGKAELFQELLDLLSENMPVLDLVVLLIGTATLERSLGDLYLLQGPPPCPSMLKDLLVTSQLLDCLGPDIIQVLRILIGPPISLNLRNAAWHGFPSPGEIPRRCVCFILWLVPSIGYALDVRKIPTHDLKHREPVTFPDLILLHPMVAESIQQLTTQNESIIIQTCKTSRFVHGRTAKSDFWKTVTDFYNQKRYSFCAALLLYYLEQGLRRVFVAVNNCPDRALTAESTVLYTTFDEILDDCLPGQQDNKLIDVTGEPLMELLYDLLVHQDGPRVRDRISHGETDWDRFPRELTDLLLIVSVYLTQLFTSQHINSLSMKEKAVIQDIETIVLGYQDQFHKISAIKQKLRRLYCDTCSFDSHIHLTLDLLPRDPDYILPSSDQHLKLCSCIDVIVKQVFKHWDISTVFLEGQIFKCISEPFNIALATSTFTEILKPKIQTIYRSRIWKKAQVDSEACSNRENEVLGLLQHIVTECNTIVLQMKQTLKLRHDQLQAKQLRSRQRDNLKKLLCCCPSYLASLNLTGVIVIWQLYHLDQLGRDDQHSQKTRIRFWKQLLKFSENLRTFSHPDKNKWSEGLDLILSQTEKMKHIDNEILIFK